LPVPRGPTSNTPPTDGLTSVSTSASFHLDLAHQRQEWKAHLVGQSPVAGASAQYGLLPGCVVEAVE